jgi:hypothetical protein
MLSRAIFFPLLLVIAACSQAPSGAPADITTQLGSFEHHPGYFDLYWDDKQGRLILRIDNFGEQFMYQSSMARYRPRSGPARLNQSGLVPALGAEDTPH